MDYTNETNFSGYIGAILGALIGAIPFGVGVWYGWFVGPFAAICAYASYYGYKKLGGQPTQTTKFAIPVISLIAVLLTNVVIIMIIANQAGATFSQVINFGPLQEYLRETFIMSLVFGALGVFYIFRQISEEV